jgi:hypothetical protein
VPNAGLDKVVEVELGVGLAAAEVEEESPEVVVEPVELSVPVVLVPPELVVAFVPLLDDFDVAAANLLENEMLPLPLFAIVPTFQVIIPLLRVLPLELLTKVVPDGTTAWITKFKIRLLLVLVYDKE